MFLPISAAGGPLVKAYDYGHDSAAIVSYKINDQIYVSMGSKYTLGQYLVNFSDEIIAEKKRLKSLVKAGLEGAENEVQIKAALKAFLSLDAVIVTSTSGTSTIWFSCSRDSIAKSSVEIP